MERYFTEFALAFVRGRTGRPDATIDMGLNSGLRLHKFKRNTELPRVNRVLRMLQGLAPENLLDVGSGRGTFLWPLLEKFPQLPVTAVEWSQGRVDDLRAVSSGGISRLTVLHMDVEQLQLPPRSFDVVTILEVLEHLHNPEAAVVHVMRVATRFVIASVPSGPDNNPDHLHLFSSDELQHLAKKAGCRRVAFEHVLNHRIMLCQV